MLSLVLTVIPTIMLVRGFNAEGGFLGFVLVGEVFEARALPELRAAQPPVESPHGYDGQFYAQLALDPTLRRPELRAALDQSSYRARRIGLPILAHVLGLGRPALVLQIYALLNFAFWAALLTVFLHRVGLARPRDFLLAASLLWTTGTLVSLERALTDFPAMALGVMAVWQLSRKLAPAALLGAACLVKETSILQLAAIAWPQWGSRGMGRFVGSCAIAIVPVAAWLGYVSWIHAETLLPGSGQITLPFVSLATKFLAAGGELWERVRDGGRLGRLIFELLAPASLVVQAFYLVRKPRLASRAWRFGAGFVVLLPFLGDLMWVEQYSFCRVLLPLTASFNLLVHRHEEGWGHARWFLAGNVGMIWILLRVLD